MPSYPTSWRSIFILSSHLHLGLPSGLFPSGFPTKTLYIPLLSPVSATCPAHLILLDFITRTILGEEYRSLGFFFIVLLRNRRHYLKHATTSPCRISCQFTVCVFIQDILLHLRGKINNMAVHSLLINRISLFYNIAIYFVLHSYIATISQDMQLYFKTNQFVSSIKSCVGQDCHFFYFRVSNYCVSSYPTLQYL